MSRDYTLARAKCDAEGRCRWCKRACRTEAAHIVPRRHDPPNGPVPADGIVPLCQACHRDYDLDRLDLLPVLTLEEQAFAVSRLGILRAWRRITSAAKTDTPSTG